MEKKDPLKPLLQRVIVDSGDILKHLEEVLCENQSLTRQELIQETTKAVLALISWLLYKNEGGTKGRITENSSLVEAIKRSIVEK